MYIIPSLFLAIILASKVDYFEEGRKYVQELKNKNDDLADKKLELKKQILSLKMDNPIKINDPLPNTDSQCFKNSTLQKDPESNLYVFVSFSMPDESWISLSRELSKTGGMMILRGLPKNSFKELAIKMHRLRQLGMNVTVQVDPRLFIKYTVEQVPCFVIVDGDEFDKLNGNVSLSFALQKMENKNAKILRKLL